VGGKAGGSWYGVREAAAEAAGLESSQCRGRVFDFAVLIALVTGWLLIAGEIHVVGGDFIAFGSVFGFEAFSLEHFPLNGGFWSCNWPLVALFKVL